MLVTTDRWGADANSGPKRSGAARCSPQRNGSTRDAHVLALAWSVEADVWTTDRDFAGTGTATWSTPNLMRALAEPAHDRRR